MKKEIIILSIFGLLILGGLYAKHLFFNPKQRPENTEREVKSKTGNDEIQNGDLIFQTSRSLQSKAIQLATNSKYSHCGLIFKDGKDFYVFEAVQPVKRTLSIPE